MNVLHSTDQPPVSGTETQRRVLIVDDDAVQLKLCTLQLRQVGFEVDSASGAAEAWQKIAEHRPDVIVSDVLMAEVDGFEFCRRVRQDPNLSAVPVILLSAHYGGELDRDLARKIGASAMLVRTGNFEAEIAAVRAGLQEGPVPVSPGRDSGVYGEHLRANANQLAKLVEQVQNANEHYRALFFDSASDAISLLTPEGVVLEANQRWGELLNVPARSLIGMHIRDFSPQGHEATNIERYLGSGDRGAIDAVPIRRADGGIRYMDFSKSNVSVGGNTLVLAIGRDVTKKIETMRALAEAEEKYRTLVERIPDAIWTINEKGDLTFISPNIVNITGYTAEEMCNADLQSRTDQIHPDERSRVVQAFKELVGNGKPFDVEYRRLRKDGEWVWIRNRATVVNESSGVRRWEGMITDITVTRKLEGQLRQAQKMEAVGRLAGGVAHDFNNMLNVLLGYTVMLLEDVPSNHPMHEPLVQMKIAGERSADLTRQLLAFSRQHPHAPQILCVNEVVGSMDKFTRRVVGEDVEIDTQLAADLPSIKADPGQIEQVIMNLVVNARDAMPNGGKLTIRTSMEDCEEYVPSADAIKRGRYVMIAISDSGVGMDRETQSQIFEPFFTTKEIGKGTGLGLAIVFGIVHQYEGHIWVYSEPGKGTTFKLYFPVATGKVQSMSMSPPLAASTRNCETILVVEDEEQVRTFVKTILLRQGYHVLIAGDAEEAIQVSGEHRGAIDVLLTDVIMPRSSGRQLADQLMPKFPDMKVIYMSGYTSNVVLDHGVPEGITFLQKPVLPEALSRKIRAALEQRSKVEGVA